jgi:hypothetical protein
MEHTGKATTDAELVLIGSIEPSVEALSNYVAGLRAYDTANESNAARQALKVLLNRFAVSIADHLIRSSPKGLPARR